MLCQDFAKSFVLSCRYSPNLSRRCTHLLVSSHAGAAAPSEKLSSALRNRHKWGLHLVSMGWLLCSTEHGARQPEASYAVAGDERTPLGARPTNKVCGITVSKDLGPQLLHILDLQRRPVASSHKNTLFLESLNKFLCLCRLRPGKRVPALPAVPPQCQSPVSPASRQLSTAAAPGSMRLPRCPAGAKTQPPTCTHSCLG